VFLVAIELLNRVLSIPANYVFQNLVVVKHAVAEDIIDSRQIVYFGRLRADRLTF
jgi:hypothetical protein